LAASSTHGELMAGDGRGGFRRDEESVAEEYEYLRCGDRQSEIARVVSVGAVAHRLAMIWRRRPMVHGLGVAGVLHTKAERVYPGFVGARRTPRGWGEAYWFVSRTTCSAVVSCGLPPQLMGLAATPVPPARECRAVSVGGPQRDSSRVIAPVRHSSPACPMLP